MPSLEENIAKVFGINAAQVNDELAYSEIPEWDSLNHVNLMLMLEKEYKISIDEELMVELTSVETIREHLTQAGAAL